MLLLHSHQIATLPGHRYLPSVAGATYRGPWYRWLLLVVLHQTFFLVRFFCREDRFLMLLESVSCEAPCASPGLGWINGRMSTSVGSVTLNSNGPPRSHSTSNSPNGLVSDSDRTLPALTRLTGTAPTISSGSSELSTWPTTATLSALA